MYLTFAEYQTMGGTLDSAAFTVAERKAESNINSQSLLTKSRIEKLAELPQAIKDCVFDLVEFMAKNDISKPSITSESQSQGGVSESVSYKTITPEQVAAECESIICDAFYGNGIGSLLYRGVTQYD